MTKPNLPVIIAVLTALVACSPSGGGSSPVPDAGDRDASAGEDGGRDGEDGGEDPRDAGSTGVDADPGSGEDAGRSDAGAHGGEDAGTVEECGGCPQDEKCCDGQCVEVNLNPEHCGDCNERCDARNQICDQGACIDASECGRAGECVTAGGCCGSICCLGGTRCVTEGNFIGCCPDSDDCG